MSSSLLLLSGGHQVSRSDSASQHGVFITVAHEENRFLCVLAHLFNRSLSSNNMKPLPPRILGWTGRRRGSEP